MATPSANLRVGLDANVLIAGCRWPRWPHEVLEAGRRGQFIVVLFRPVLAEARRHLDPAGIERLEAFLRQASVEWLEEPDRDAVEASSSVVRDDSDVPMAVAMMAANVDVFVTNDRDFTDLDPDSNFRRAVEVMLPAVFLRDVCGWTSVELEGARHRDWPVTPS